jgi:hypothetical protein
MKSLFRCDLFGGLTAGIVALPLALAFGVSSGLGPSAGLYGCYQQLWLGTPMGNKPLSNNGLIIFTLFGIGFVFFFWNNQLITRIDATGIHVHFYPYAKRSVAWEEVAHCQVIPYDFVGGWGVRLWTQFGTVYNVIGGKGLYVQLKNKKKFLVGTQQPEELEQFLTELISLREVITE